MKPTLAIYGIKAGQSDDYPTYTHDHNICLMQDGKILQYIQLERFTRKKYDNRLDLFIEQLIEENILQLPDEFDVVFVNSFESNSFISANGKIKFESSKLFPFPPRLVTDCFCRFYIGKLKNYEPDSYMLSHELAHIYSNLPFFGMFRENSLLVHFDGGASIGNFSAFTYKNNKIEFIESGWEMSYLSKFFNDNALNFAILGANQNEHNSVPGKLMGFASLGKYSKQIEDFLINNDFFKDIWNNYKPFFAKVNAEFNINIKSFNTKTEFLQDIAATFQKIFERETINKLKELQKKTGTEYLYYSGGCALNITTNSEIIRQRIFKDIFIPPACNDSGLSIGAAAMLEFQKHGTIKLHSPYLNNFSLKVDSSSKIKTHKIGYSKNTKYSEDLIIQATKLILAGKILGVSNGFGECGPRALGNRSILCRADSIELSQKVSMQCKKREWYRPVAPVMLKESAEKTTGQNIPQISKYMLADFIILSEYKEVLQGVIHADGTARIQVISKRNENPFLFDLLVKLWNNHQIYALINTSFNSQGEPIVQSREDAFLSAKKMNLDAVIIDYELFIFR